MEFISNLNGFKRCLFLQYFIKTNNILKKEFNKKEYNIIFMIICKIFIFNISLS